MHAFMFFFIILSLHTKADRLQNQNHMSVVFITYSSEGGGGDGGVGGGITVVSRSILRCQQGFIAS